MIVPESKIKKVYNNLKDPRSREKFFFNEMVKEQQQRILQLDNFYQKYGNKEDMEKNRYMDILPYPETLIVESPYFNGNRIKLRDSMTLYMCQAPVNIKEFHEIICQIRPKWIIQVSPFAESGIPKVLRYVPLVEDEDNEYTINAKRAAVLFEKYGMIKPVKYEQTSSQKEGDMLNYDKYEFEYSSFQLKNGYVVTAKMMEPNQKYDEYMVRMNIKYTYNSDQDQNNANNTNISSTHLNLCEYNYDSQIQPQQPAEARSSQDEQEKSDKNHENQNKNTDFIVKYIYVRHWSDSAAPNNVEHIMELCELIGEPDNVLIHCSAGVGRSGTLAVCMQLYDEIVRKQITPTSIIDIVENLRMKRNPVCVQTPQQFEFLYQFQQECYRMKKSQKNKKK